MTASELRRLLANRGISVSRFSIYRWYWEGIIEADEVDGVVQFNEVDVKRFLTQGSRAFKQRPNVFSR